MVKQGFLLRKVGSGYMVGCELCGSDPTPLLAVCAECGEERVEASQVCALEGL